MTWSGVCEWCALENVQVELGSRKGLSVVLVCEGAFKPALPLSSSNANPQILLLNQKPKIQAV